MPLYINTVNADIDTTGSGSAQLQPSSGAVAAPAPAAMDIEQIRPLVLRILQEEMASVLRQQG